MALSVSKPMSLVEQKRLQWAREREEMAGLCSPWGPTPSRENQDAFRSTIRTHFLSTMELNQTNTDSLQTKQHVEQSYDESIGRVRRRSPSLPPIYTRTIHSGQEGEDSVRVHEDEGETETSGYASESGGNEIRQGDFWQQQQQHAASWVSEQRHRHHEHHGDGRPLPYNRGYVTPDSVVSTPTHRWSFIGSDESNRPRWGDRGVGVGHLWEPTFHEPDCRLPQVQGSDRGTPSWLERGLSKLGDSQVLVINHGTDQGSNLPCSLTGSCDTISTLHAPSHSDCGRTFLRGQNVPLEPDILMERERKRQKALEHQNAIRLQLEERDRKRKEERDRRAKEERDEEERIKREQDREKRRHEEELSKQREREEKEARKAKAMREALENAQKLAKQEKLRARAKHTSIPVQQDHENERGYICPNSTGGTSNQLQSQSIVLDTSENQIKSIISRPCGKIEPIKCSNNKEKVITAYTTGNAPSNIALVADALGVPADGVAVVLGAPQTADGSLTSHEVLPTSGSTVQLALLMPPATSLAGSPLMVEDRLLTPTRYRHHARGTQTDTDYLNSTRMSRSKIKHDIINMVKERKKSASLDRPHRGCKLPLRCRSQSQPNQPRLSIEERPKWGVNRPPMQYIKQSERDPYYQRRLRQRLLRAAMLAGSHGSGSGGVGMGNGGGMGCGEGETGTESDTCPQRRSQRTRQDSSERNTRSPSPQQNSFASSHKHLYYQQPQKFSERSSTEKPDVSVISLDLSDLQSFENQNISDGRKKDSMSRNRTYNVGSPSKRVQVLTLSQNVPHRFSGSSSKKKSNDLFASSLSSIPKNFSNKGYSQKLLHRKPQSQVALDIKVNGDVDQWTSQDILSQLTSLRQGLLIKQQEWEARKNQFSHTESFW